MLSEYLRVHDGRKDDFDAFGSPSSKHDLDRRIVARAADAGDSRLGDRKRKASESCSMSEMSPKDPSPGRVLEGHMSLCSSSYVHELPGSPTKPLRSIWVDSLRLVEQDADRHGEGST